MQLETDFQGLGAPDVAPLPSAARLAAEAFFAPATTAAPQAPVATPVVWLRKARAEPILSDTAVDPAPIDGGQRTPRIFRVEPAAPQPQAALSPTQSDLTTIPEVAASLPEHPSIPPLRRRKRRQLHGNVTIIRPQDETLQKPGAGRPVPAAAATSGGDRAYATVSRERRGAALRPKDDAWPHYPKLLARIRLLQAEAERARQREAVAALRWIKRDIARYGLTAEDLGFH